MRRRGRATAAAMALVMLLGTSAGSAIGHVEAIVTFDPEQGQLPEGVAVDAGGNIYASLTTLGQLVRIPAGSSEPEPFGVIEGLAAGDVGPVGLAVDVAGNVYGGAMSADPEVNGVWRFDAATGAGERIDGSEEIGFANAVAFADDGTLYATDTIAGAVWRVQAGTPAELWVQDELLEGTGEAGFGFPLGANGIAIGASMAYISVTEKSTIVAVPILEDGRAGEPSLFAQLSDAVDGIAIGPAGDIISAHPLANLVTRRYPDGRLDVIADESDGLDRPSSIALWTDDDGSTTAYVANFSIAMGTPLGHGPSIQAIELDYDEAGGDDGTTAPAGTVTVTAGDLFFDPARFTIPSEGTTAFVLVNEGRVEHTFIIDALGVAIGTDPKTSGDFSVSDPPPGEYPFYCSIVGHRLAGMVGTLIVE